MQVLIFALISLIKLVHGGLLDGLLGQRNPATGVNRNGLVHPLNPALGDPLCELGIGCIRCPNGLLKVLDPTLGDPVNYLGLGADCLPIGGGGKGDEDDNEKKPTKSPITQPPVTQPPVTQPPVTQPPVTQPPVTQAPITKPPVTQPPITKPPITPPPVTPPEDCFSIGIPLEDTDYNFNGGYNDNDGDDAPCDCYNGNYDEEDDWEDCDDESECEDFDCSQCDLLD